jgi:ABC-type multidrug transport system ATPase subunit
LFALIRRHRRVVGVIYITHRMSEIRRIGDRITVLRDGRLIDTVDKDHRGSPGGADDRSVISEIYLIPHAPGSVSSSSRRTTVS